MGVPKNGWFIMENPMKNGRFGGTPSLGNVQKKSFYDEKRPQTPATKHGLPIFVQWPQLASYRLGDISHHIPLTYKRILHCWLEKNQHCRHDQILLWFHFKMIPRIPITPVTESTKCGHSHWLMMMVNDD